MNKLKIKGFLVFCIFFLNRVYHFVPMLVTFFQQPGTEKQTANFVSTQNVCARTTHGVRPLVDPFRSHVSRSLFKCLPRFLPPVGEQRFITLGNLLRGILFTCCIQFLLYSSNLSKIGVIFNSFAICAMQYVMIYKHQRLSNTLSYSPDCSPSSMLSYHTAYTEAFPC